MSPTIATRNPIQYDLCFCFLTLLHPQCQQRQEVRNSSKQTLSRLFAAETGQTFADWRKRLQLQEAIKRLEAGWQVTRIAFDLGYQSLSAFIEMFRKEMGASPGAWRSF